MNCFRCARTGVLYPEDYVEEWGRKYGIGLGPVPVSEALTNQYHIEVASSSDPRKTMHPVGVARAQLDFLVVPDAEFEEKKAIIAADDPDMVTRGQLMRTKQLSKSSEMRMMFQAEVKALEAEEAVVEGA